MATDEAMKQKVYELVKARDRRMAAKAVYDEQLKAFQDRTKPLLEELALATADVQKLNDELKKLAVSAYTQTGNKKFFGGVVVKVFRHLKYDALKAMDWARKNMPILVKVHEDLDRRAFDAVVASEQTVDGKKQLVVMEGVRDVVSVEETASAQVPEVLDVQVDP